MLTKAIEKSFRKTEEPSCIGHGGFFVHKIIPSLNESMRGIMDLGNKEILGLSDPD